MEETQEVLCQSGKRIVLKELNALQQTNADKAADSPIAVMSYRAAMAMASINDETLEPAKDNLALETRLQRLSGRDLRQITEVYARSYQLTAEELGNEFRPSGQ